MKETNTEWPIELRDKNYPDFENQPYKVIDNKGERKPSKVFITKKKDEWHVEPVRNVIDLIKWHWHKWL